MKPKKPDNSPDLFRAQLSQILNMDHALVRLSHQMKWDDLVDKLEVVYSSGAGQPPLPTRLMAGLHYLKYTFNLSDERVVTQWVENPYWQYFCGYEYLQHEFPSDPSSLTRWRNRMGDRLEALLAHTIDVALEKKIIKPIEFKYINVDTTVQEKDITFPTDAKLYNKMREVLVKEAQSQGILLRQSYKKVGKKALIMQGRYSHARQMKRARKQTRRLKTYLGRVVRDVRRKLPSSQQGTNEKLTHYLEIADKLLLRERKSKNKIYSIHALEVECIAKGKVHKPYEFGNKASFATTSKHNWIVSALSLKGNPYDGHTLENVLTNIEEITGKAPQHVYCDMGYKGHGIKKEQAKVHLVGRIPKTASKSERSRYKRRASIEPTIGHLKSDHRLSRNHLKGDHGNRANVILSAASYNFAKLLAWFYCAYQKHGVFSNFLFYKHRKKPILQNTHSKLLFKTE